MRRSPRAEAERWLEQAEADLGWTRRLRDEGAHHLACFLAQQVAEKALKAVHYADGAEIVLGHSVARLCSEAGARHPELAAGCARWAVLDTYYVATRYPNGLPDSIPARVYTAEEAARAVALAEEVVAAVRAVLEPRPPATD